MPATRPARRDERLGLFGGTFDPPHIGHLVLAEWACEKLSLDRVLFIPAGRPPHKHGRRVSPVRHRLAMARLAVRGNPRFRVSTLELERATPSWTIDTLRAIARWHRGERYLIVGGDSLDDFRGWVEPEAILELATLAVAARPGTGHSRARAWVERRGRVVWIGDPALDVSSSALRQRVRDGHSIRYLVPDAVARYVTRHRLYR
jgi:nicotinate-nucleotide adenylyltransferase